jgi:integrase
VSPQTANVHLKILRIMFGAAEADGVLLRNPARFVKSLKVRGESTRRPFTLAELKRVLEVADDEWRSLILFGFYTGQRLADLAGLTWQNVDLQRGELRLVTGKTGRRMILPLAKPLRDHLERLPAGDDPKAPLHPRMAGVVARQGRVGNLSNQFIDLLAQAGLVKARTHKAPKDGTGDGAGRKAKRHASELSFHSLRHSFVTALKATGAAEAVAMDLAGHDSAEISRHYTSLDSATKRAALDRLPVLA